MSNTNNRASVRISFLGAAGSVTGSKFLVENDDHKILVDCGLFQGRKELRQRNWQQPPFEPSEISAIVLTHAHIDHTGYLPLVVREGYKGPIYCTPATKSLLALLLPDSAHLQEEQARHMNKYGLSRHKPAKPLYTGEDAQKTLELLKAFPRDRTTEIFPNVFVTAKCAGHILGSNSISLDINGKRISFSGDIGRYGTPILPDPQGIDLGDMLLIESTYGDRLHQQTDLENELSTVIKSAIDRRGPLIIPSFAIGRTQNLLYSIAKLERDGRIPVIPVAVDSPMAVDATSIYREFRHDYDEDAKEILNAGETPLMTEKTGFCRSRKESQFLNTLRGPRIIISASGMVTGGRILHHLKHWIDEENTTVLFVGYQAEGTRGNLLQSGASEIKIFGQSIPVRANIQTISGLSAHGDKNELLRWLRSCSGNPEVVKVVHGEPSSSKSFANTLSKEFSWDASPAKYLEKLTL